MGKASREIINAVITGTIIFGGVYGVYSVFKGKSVPAEQYVVSAYYLETALGGPASVWLEQQVNYGGVIFPPGVAFDIGLIPNVKYTIV